MKKKKVMTGTTQKFTEGPVRGRMLQGELKCDVQAGQTQGIFIKKTAFLSPCVCEE